MTKLSDTESSGDSVSLAKIGTEAFTPIAAVQSDYTEGDAVTAGVKITTKESFEIDGVEYNKLHTTRKAVVTKMLSEAVQAAMAGEGLDPVKCVPATFANGKSGFKLEDA